MNIPRDAARVDQLTTAFQQRLERVEDMDGLTLSTDEIPLSDGTSQEVPGLRPAAAQMRDTFNGLIGNYNPYLAEDDPARVVFKENRDAPVVGSALMVERPELDPSSPAYGGVMLHTAEEPNTNRFLGIQEHPDAQRDVYRADLWERDPTNGLFTKTERREQLAGGEYARGRLDIERRPGGEGHYLYVARNGDIEQAAKPETQSDEGRNWFQK